MVIPMAAKDRQQVHVPDGAWVTADKHSSPAFCVNYFILRLNGIRYIRTLSGGSRMAAKVFISYRRADSAGLDPAL